MFERTRVNVRKNAYYREGERERVNLMNYLIVID